MRTRRSVDARAIATIAAGYLAGLAAYPMLPGPFLQEKPSARALVAFTLPTTALVVYTLFRSLWQHDRVRSGNGLFESTYLAIVLWVLLFIVSLHALVMVELTAAASAIGIRLSGGRIVIVLLGLVMVAIGNLLPRTRPNVAVGLRTRRTLADPQLWQQVHRSGGYVTVVFGLVIALAGVVLAHNVAGAVVSAAGAAAVASIFMFYRRHAAGMPQQNPRG